MDNKNQYTTEVAQSQDTLTRDFVTAAMTVSVLVNLTVFIAWLTVLFA